MFLYVYYFKSCGSALSLFLYHHTHIATYQRSTTTIEKYGITTCESGAPLPRTEIESMHESIKDESATNGSASTGKIININIESAPKSIESGTSGAMRIFAGIDTNDTMPILYATKGSTVRLVAIVAETISFSPSINESVCYFILS